jgi:hypothetical protein
MPSSIPGFVWMTSKELRSILKITFGFHTSENLSDQMFCYLLPIINYQPSTIDFSSTDFEPDPKPISCSHPHRA